MKTPYAQRITLAAGISLVAHALFLVALALAPESWTAEAAPETPMRLRLEAVAPVPEPVPTPDAPRRLIDAIADDLPPEQPTDLIAVVNSRARDMAGETGNDNAPRVDAVDEFDRLAALAPRPASELSPAPPAPRLDTLEPIAPEQPESEPAAPPPPRDELPRQGEAPRPEVRPAEREPIAIAQARPEPPEQANREPREPVSTPPAEIPAGSSRGRMQGAVMSKGFLGFEAMRDDIAPYLRNVQERVERQWRLMMELEYRGTARARAVVDCAIRPDGQLAFVRIHDDGGNLPFAAACAGAIRRSGPFGPFPFEVPALYREEEIIIRWTFQFL